jgi:hypothetical protein
MPKRNGQQPELLPDPAIEAIPEHFVLTEKTLKAWSKLPEPEKSWELMAEVINALNEFTGQHAQLKRTTITELVWAELNNESARSVFQKDTTCNESTWHKRWKHDPLIQRVYKYVSSAARTFTTAQEAVKMMEAKRRAQEATPYAATIMINTLGSDRPELALRAAIELLKMTGVFNEDGDAGINLTVNNSATAQAAAGVNLDDWLKKAKRSRGEAAEAALLASTFIETDRGDDDDDAD